MVQGLIGGAVGLVLGIAGIVLINVLRPTVAASSAGQGAGPGGMGPGPTAVGAGCSRLPPPTSSSRRPSRRGCWWRRSGLAVLGGLVAGAFGGWRAARLSPAEALRSVAMSIQHTDDVPQRTPLPEQSFHEKENRMTIADLEPTTPRRETSTRSTRGVASRGRTRRRAAS